MSSQQRVEAAGVSAQPRSPRSHLFPLVILLPPFPTLSDQPCSRSMHILRTHLPCKRPIRDHSQTHAGQPRRGLPGLLVRLVRPRGFGELVSVIRPAVDRGDAEVRVAPDRASVLVPILPGNGTCPTDVHYGDGTHDGRA